MTNSNKIKEPLWDKEEWIILIANLQKNNFQPLEEIQKEQISKVLKRYLSIKNNFKPIDEGYRNVNGINWQSNNLLKYLNTNNSNIHLSRAAIKTLTFYKDNYEELSKESKKLMFKVDYAFEHKVHFGKFNFLCNDIHKYELTIRTLNVLKNREIDFIYELIFYTGGELLRFSNFGRNSLNEIIDFLQNEFKLSLATDIHSKEFLNKYLDLDKDFKIEPYISKDENNYEITEIHQFKYDLPDITEENLILKYYDHFKIKVIKGRILNRFVDSSQQSLNLVNFSARTINIIKNQNITKNSEIIDLYRKGVEEICRYQNSGIKTYNEIEKYVKDLEKEDNEIPKNSVLSKNEISYFLQPLELFSQVVDLDLKLLNTLKIYTVMDLYVHCKSKNLNFLDYFNDYLKCFVGLDYKNSLIELDRSYLKNLNEEISYNLLNDICKNLLKPNQYEVLKLRFGLDLQAKLTLEEIAILPNFDVTRERIRQIEAKALTRLRLNKSKFIQIFNTVNKNLEKKLFYNNVFQQKEFKHSNILIFLTELIYKSQSNWLNNFFYKINNAWININLNPDEYDEIDKKIKKIKFFPYSIIKLSKDINISEKLIKTYLGINKYSFIIEDEFFSKNEGHTKARRRLRVFSLINKISKKFKLLLRIENVFIEYKKIYKDDKDVFYRDIYQIIRYEFQESGLVNNFKDNVFYLIDDILKDTKIQSTYLKFIDIHEHYDFYYQNKETIKDLYDYLKINGPKRIYEVTEEFHMMHNIPKGSITRYLSINGGFHKLLPGLIGISEHLNNKNLIRECLNDSQSIDNYILLRYSGCDVIDFPYLCSECDQIIAEYIRKEDLTEKQMQLSKLNIVENLQPNEKKYYLNLRSSLDDNYIPIKSHFENYVYNLDINTLKEIIILSSFFKSISYIHINKYILGTRFQSLKYSIPYMICLDALGLLEKFQNYFDKVFLKEDRLKLLIKNIIKIDEKNLKDLILSELSHKNMIFFNEEDLNKISFDEKSNTEITDFDLFDF